MEEGLQLRVVVLVCGEGIVGTKIYSFCSRVVALVFGRTSRL